MRRMTLSLVCAGLACLAAPAAAEDLRFGVVTHLSGAAAGPFGIPARNGFELVVEAINNGTLPAPYASKGFGGKVAKITLLDEAGPPARIATEIRNLVTDSAPHAVMGFVTAGTCLAAVPVLEELKTLTVISTCGTPRIFEDGTQQYIFRTASNVTMDGVTAARYITARMPDIKNYAGLNQNFAFGQDSWRDFTLAMQALKPKLPVVLEQFPTLGSGQYGTEISALLAAKPDVTFSSFFGSDLEAFTFQMAPRNLQKSTQMIMSAGETAMFRLGARLPDGIIIAGRGPYGLFAHDTPLNQWFRKAFEDRYAVPPTYSAYHAAQAVLALKLAYDKAAAQAGDTAIGPLQVAAALRGLDYEAFGTHVRLGRSNGQDAVTESAIGIYKFDRETGRPTLTDVRYYPADCVNVPDGVKAADWLKAGMPGAKCD